MKKIYATLFTLISIIGANAQSLVGLSSSSATEGETVNITFYATATSWNSNAPAAFMTNASGDTISGTGISVSDDTTMSANFVIPCALNNPGVLFDVKTNDIGSGLLTLSSNFMISDFSASTSTTDETGGCDGTATINPLGGTAPYSYYWYQTTNTGAFESNLCPGSYFVSVTDNNSCVLDSVQALITNNPCATFDVTYFPLGNESSTGACDGASQAYVNSGTAPYTYEWSTAETTDVLYTLCGGMHWVVITDANACSDTVSVEVETNGPCTGFEVYNEPIYGATSAGACDAIVQIYSNSSNYPVTFEWSNASTLELDSNVCTGNYWVVGTDNIGCSDTLSFFVDSVYNPCIGYNAGAYNVINASDTNTCNGSALAGGNYGTGPFTYLWSNASTLETNTSLCFGNQWVEITDANSCVDTAFFFIDSVFNACDYYSVFIANNQNELGAGACDGFAIAGGYYGTAPYTYLWNTSATSDSIGSLCPGTYSVVVTDANSCVDSTTILIETDCMLDFSASIVNNVSCFGLNDGSIDVISDGTAPFLYSIDGVNIDSVGFYGNLTPGNYTMLSEDVNECFGEYQFTISEPAQLAMSVNTNLPTCGANDGSAEMIGMSGGVTPYSFQWTSGNTTALANNLSAGTYVATLLDANECYISETVNLSSSAAPAVSVNLTSPTCAGLKNGSIDLTLTGGVTPYTFDWSTGAQTEDINTIFGGTYDVTIEDAAGCVISQIIILPKATPIDLANVTMNPASCGLADGDIQVTPAGGAGTYTYLWSTGGTTSIENSLTAGTYSVTVTDLNGCVKSKTYALSNDVAPIITVDQVDQPACEGGDGMIAVSVAGGTAPYTYAWSDGSNGQNLISAIIGNYELIVTDASNCKGVAYAELEGINLNAAEICLASVDTTTNGNLIVWNKEFGLGIAEYEIYRETAIFNEFQYLETVPFDSLSQYIDASANPTIHSYKYKLRTIDSCANASDFLALHKTIHLVASLDGSNNIQLNWDDYIGMNYSSFYIHRFHPSTGWEIIDSVSSNVHTYTDLTFPSFSNLFYSIVVLPDSPCSAEKALDHNSTRSNKVTIASVDNTNAVFTNDANTISIWPNPSSGLINLSIFQSYNQMEISVVDLNGKIVRNFNSIQGINTYEMNIQDFESGIYFVHITLDDNHHVVKIVKN